MLTGRCESTLPFSEREQADLRIMSATWSVFCRDGEFRAVTFALQKLAFLWTVMTFPDDSF
jgi:hypothetical protein